MSNVLVERARRGAHSKFSLRKYQYNRKTRTRDGEDAPPKMMPMRFARRRDRA
jgi:hypothetical protein